VGARGFERLPGALPVVGENRGLLAPRLGSNLGERPRYRFMDSGASLEELRAISNLLSEGVLEGVAVGSRPPRLVVSPRFSYGSSR
jgi:hypothetical protein